MICTECKLTILGKSTLWNGVIVCGGCQKHLRYLATVRAVEEVFDNPSLTEYIRENI